MHARRSIKNLWFRQPALGNRPRRRFLLSDLIRRKTAHQFLLLIKNFKFDVMGAARKVIIEDSPIRRIFRRGLLRRQRSPKKTIVINANPRRGPVKPRPSTLHRIMNLPQRRNVIKNPE